MKDAGKLRQASIGICVPSDSDRQYRTVVWCRFGGLVLSVRRPCTVGSAALYCRFNGLVLTVQRPCTGMAIMLMCWHMARTDATARLSTVIFPPDGRILFYLPIVWFSLFFHIFVTDSSAGR